MLLLLVMDLKVNGNPEKISLAEILGNLDALAEVATIVSGNSNALGSRSCPGDLETKCGSLH